jgi:hypoxanthine-DNA glycosylase
MIKMAKRTVKVARARGFPPIAGRDAVVLVLGSMPSVASLAQREYYAHPQNAFWPIMGRLFGAGRELPYAERVTRLRLHGVAVWDVLRECRRAGSLDSAIHAESEMPNDFLTFFRQHARICAVFFNGGKAESAFRRHVLPTLSKFDRPLSYLRLPSTSPAHAGRRFEEKLAAWRQVCDALEVTQ